MVEGTGVQTRGGKHGRTDRHILHLSPELEGDLEDLKQALVVHETAGVAKAYLGTSVGAAAATVAVIVALLSFPPTQKMVTAFLAFVRLQIASIAKDIAFQVVPTPAEVVDDIAEGAKEVGKTAKETWDEINRRLRETFEESGVIEEGADPAGDFFHGLQELLRRIVEDPLFGTGGGKGGPIIPGV